jgi:phosphoglycolate phosphatase
MKVDLIIFDLDGTLLNTLEDLADSGNYILNRYGFPQHPLSSYRFFVGDGILKLVERILPEDKKEKDFVLSFKEEFVKYYNQHKSDKTAPYPGIINVLETIQNKHIKIAVASNKSHQMMHALMQHYFPTIHFSAIYGQRPGIPTKPNPTIVFDILKETASVKEQTLYVGDTSVDIQTAKNAGLKSIGVLWGFRSREELVTAGADDVINHPDDLLKLLFFNK